MTKAKMTKEEAMQRLAEYERLEQEQKEKKRQYLREYRQRMKAEGLTSTNIFLGDDVREWLQAEAERTRENHSEIVNRIIRDHIAQADTQEPTPEPVRESSLVEAPQEEGSDTETTGADTPDELAKIRAALNYKWDYAGITERLISWITQERGAGRQWQELADQLNESGISTEKGKDWNRKSLEAFYRRKTKDR